jgi:hypothetical protein
LEGRVAPGGPEIDLTRYFITTTSGLVRWTIYAPGDPGEVRLPLLQENYPEQAVPSGNLQIAISVARIDDFDYRNLSESQLSTAGWDAYAIDVFQSWH